MCLADHLEKKEICDPLGKKRESLQLSNGPDAAAIVKPLNTFDHWQVQTDKLCKFVFKARKGEHLFTVIQNMSLRRNGTECLDYIKVMISVRIDCNKLFKNLPHLKTLNSKH